MFLNKNLQYLFQRRIVVAITSHLFAKVSYMKVALGYS